MKCLIEFVFLPQCCVASPKVFSADSILGFRFALNQEAGVQRAFSLFTNR